MGTRRRGAFLLVVTLGVLLPSGVVQSGAGQDPEKELRDAKQQLMGQWLRERDGYWDEVEKSASRGNVPEAVAVGQRLLATDRQFLGDAHEKVADSLARMTELHLMRDDFPAARQTAREWIDVRTKLHGAGDWRVTDARLAANYVERLSRMNRNQGRRLAENDQLAARGRALHQDGKFRDALDCHERALAVYAELLGEEHRSWVTTLYNLAVTCDKLGDHRRVQASLRQALRVGTKVFGEGHPHNAAALASLGVMYDALGRYREAETHLLQAQAVYKRTLGPLHADYYGNLHNLASVYRHLGEYARAEALLQEALASEKQAVGDEHRHYAASLWALASLYQTTGDYRHAKDLARRSTDILKKVLGDKHPEYALGLLRLGELHEHVGHFEAAEPLLRQALETTAQSLGDAHQQTAACMTSLAYLYQQLGDYARALPLARRAAEVVRQVQGEHHSDYATALNNLATLYELTGEFDRVEPLYREALEVMKNAVGTEHAAYALPLSNLGAVHLARKDHVKAEPVLRQVVAIRRKALGENHPHYAEALRLLGEMYREAGDLKRAEPLLLQSLEVTEKALGKTHPAVEPTLRGLGILYQATGRTPQARVTLGRALEVEQANLEAVFRFTAEPAMQAYLARVSGTLDLVLSLPLAGESSDDRAAALTWTLRRKAIILNALCRFGQAQAVLARDAALRARVERLRGLQRHLTDLVVNPPPGLDATGLRQRVETVSADCNRLEAELHRTLLASPSERFGGTTRPDAGQVLRALAPEAALVEFVRTQPYDFAARGRERPWKQARYYAFVLTAGTNAAPRLLDLGEADEIDRAIREVRENLGRAPRELTTTGEKGLESEYRTTGQALYRALFAPLRPALGPASLVYLAPDGELNRVAFEALVGPDGKYLIESYRIAYLSSGRDLLRLSADPARGTTVFAGPDYDAARPRPAAATHVPAEREVRGLRWQPLPGAAEEAADLQQALKGTAYAPVRCYVGREAAEEAFLTVRVPRVLHVATHGFFLPDARPEPDKADVAMGSGPAFAATRGLARLRRMSNPLLRSGLVLAGANATGEGGAPAGTGWVTAAQVARMDLHGTDLVVLSACESGLGDVKARGEGVYGLRRAFLYAGARTLVTSLYKVPDRETRELMRDFYRGLRGGAGKLDALHDAQRDMIRRRREANGAAHPFFWASFILVGRPD